MKLKLCSLLAVTAIALQSQNATKHQNDTEAEKLNGHVKSLSVYIYSKELPASDSDIDSNYTSKIVTIFNQSGNITTLMMGSKSKPETLLTTYDRSGKKISIIHSSGEAVETSLYSKNQQNRLVETISYGGRAMIVLVYNANGYRDTMHSYNYAGRLAFNVTYHYDKNNNITEAIWLKPDGSPDHRIIYTYNNGDKIKEARYDAQGNLRSWMSYSYGNHHEMLTERDSSNYYMGAAGYVRDPDNEKVYSRTFRYGNFDEKNNWQRQDIIKDSKPIYTTIRRIIYY